MSKMKICVVVGAVDLSRVTKVAAMQALHLKFLGHDVTFLSLTSFCQWREGVDLLTRHGVNVVFLPDIKAPKGRRLITLLSRALRKVKLQDYDLVIAHNQAAAMCIRDVDRTLYYIHDVANSPLYLISKSLAHMVEKRLIRNVPVVACNSMVTSDQVLALVKGRHKDKIYVVPPAVLYAAKRRSRELVEYKLSRTPTAITVCRLGSEARQTLEIIEESGLNKLVNINVVVYGRGKLDLPPLENVYYWYNISENTLWALYEQAWFVLCFHNENFGLFALEAMSCGAIPLVHVTAKFGLIRHIPSDMYVNVTTSSLVPMVKYLIKNVEHLEQEMLRIHYFVLERFNYARHVEMLLDIASRHIPTLR